MQKSLTAICGRPLAGFVLTFVSIFTSAAAFAGPTLDEAKLWIPPNVPYLLQAVFQFQAPDAQPENGDGNPVEAMRQSLVQNHPIEASVTSVNTNLRIYLAKFGLTKRMTASLTLQLFQNAKELKRKSSGNDEHLDRLIQIEVLKFLLNAYLLKGYQLEFAFPAEWDTFIVGLISGWRTEILPLGERELKLPDQQYLGDVYTIDSPEAVDIVAKGFERKVAVTLDISQNPALHLSNVRYLVNGRLVPRPLISSLPSIPPDDRRESFTDSGERITFLPLTSSSVISTAKTRREIAQIHVINCHEVTEAIDDL